MDWYWAHFKENLVQNRTLRMIADKKKSDFPQATILQVAQITESPEFGMIQIEKCSKAAVCYAQWLKCLVALRRDQEKGGENEDGCAVCMEEYLSLIHI